MIARENLVAVWLYQRALYLTYIMCCKAHVYTSQRRLPRSRVLLYMYDPCVSEVAKQGTTALDCPVTFCFGLRSPHAKDRSCAAATLCLCYIYYKQHSLQADCGYLVLGSASHGAVVVCIALHDLNTATAASKPGINTTMAVEHRLVTTSPIVLVDQVKYKVLFF